MIDLSPLLVLASSHARASNDTDRWKELDAASYDLVATEFDAFSRRLATPVSYRLVALAALHNSERALDVGTGTGMIPFAMARTAPKSCCIVGIDNSIGMIDAARASAQSQRIPASRVTFRQMDAEALTFPDASFDVVTSAFALGHIPRPERAMSEMFRVLRPGGRLFITVGSRPAALSFDAAEHAVSEIGRRFESLRGLRQSSDLLDRIVDRRLPPEADEPQGSPLATQETRGAAVAALAHEAGFARISHSWRNYQNEVATADEFWRMQRTLCTRARKRLLSASQETIAQIRDEFLTIASRTLKRGGHLVYPISAAYVMAKKPARPEVRATMRM